MKPFQRALLRREARNGRSVAEMGESIENFGFRCFKIGDIIVYLYIEGNILRK